MALRCGKTAFALGISDPSLVGEARRRAVVLAKENGFDERMQGRLSLIVTEAGNNLTAHAQDGELVVQVCDKEAMEVLVLDRGPGITNLPMCLRDGYSTRGTPGTGLGAIRRLSDSFDIHSHPSVGTAILARVGNPSSSEGGPFDIGAVSVSFPGERVCGDGWTFKMLSPSRLQVLLVDGLGHGLAAGEAADAAVAAFSGSDAMGGEAVLANVHQRLRKTRGAAAAIVDINLVGNETGFVGVGNIAAMILLPGEHVGFASLAGIVGHEVRKMQEFRYRWDTSAVLVASTDGLKTRWNLDSPAYAGVLQKKTSLIAGILYRDFQREKDDVTVVVVRQRGPNGK